LTAITLSVENLRPSIELSSHNVEDNLVLDPRDAAMAVAGAARFGGASLAGGPVAMLDFLLSRTLARRADSAFKA